MVESTDQFYARENALAFEHALVVQTVLIGQGRAGQIEFRSP